MPKLVELFLIYYSNCFLVNTYQALKILNVGSGSSQEEIKMAYRRLALEVHPDKNKNKKEDTEFKEITEAYTYLKKNYKQKSDLPHQEHDKNRSKADYERKPQREEVPEQDWGRYTRGFEESDPDFWKEYESNFWKEYNANIHQDGRNGEYDKAREAKKQPNLFVDVDKSLCIGCCSCETIAPKVFEVDKNSRSNPKSSVINQKGAGMNKIMNAAETCPTKAIRVEDTDTKERMFPY